MDVKPDDINPSIVKIGRDNPLVRQIFHMYLAEVPVVDGEPLTWRQALEIMVEKLSKQYSGALEGWKDAAVAAEKATFQENGTQLALVDEKPVEVVVEDEVATLKRDLDLAKGVLRIIMSPLRAAFAAHGRAEDAPPIQLSQSVCEQIARIVGGEDTKPYVQPNECPKCGHRAWFVQDGEAKCAVCDARAGKLKLVNEKQQLKTLLAQALESEFGKKELKKLEKLLTSERPAPL